MKDFYQCWKSCYVNLLWKWYVDLIWCWWEEYTDKITQENYVDMIQDKVYGMKLYKLHDAATKL